MTPQEEAAYYSKVLEALLGENYRRQMAAEEALRKAKVRQEDTERYEPDAA